MNGVLDNFGGKYRLLADVPLLGVLILRNRGQEEPFERNYRKKDGKNKKENHICCHCFSNGLCRSACGLRIYV